MLVLSRNHGESIQIGDSITITVLEAGRKQAKLGINAPKSIPVDRSEVLEQRRKEAESKRTDNKPKEAANERR